MRKALALDSCHKAHFQGRYPENTPEELRERRLTIGVCMDVDFQKLTRSKAMRRRPCNLMCVLRCKCFRFRVSYLMLFKDRSSRHAVPQIHTDVSSPFVPSIDVVKPYLRARHDCTSVIVMAYQNWSSGFNARWAGGQASKRLQYRVLNVRLTQQGCSAFRWNRPLMVRIGA